MFRWSEKYCIGVDSIDQQHKSMFEIANRLNKLNLSELRDDKYIEVVIILNELLIYSNDHFKDEENYMKSIGYPDLEDHKKGHQIFIDYVSSIDIQASDIDQEALIQDLFTFIEKWIKEHIIIEDKKIIKQG